MNPVATSAIALVVGVAIGSGATFALTSSPRGSDLEIPSQEEAQSSLQAAKGDFWPNLKLTLGQCDKDTMGPGVRCAVDVSFDGFGGPQQQKAIVGFSKTPSGWMASHYQ
ncbi:MAG: hypothetical protein E5X53_34145 [Mesorhizobium sp.]|uniref:hypothetical protein n=1 Tax=Mesorhizobium sp. TaxID=1871066 RepID=UPI000FE996B2|nr:hypothetical protein [Mesorhizobium sp.]RWG41485.1 MAG: hypothetical protein EOQ63_28170 [Mesorhizobium sp.]RWG57965.1 MAG: hypothetical protein EOQ65_21540 [Mesorhizobium sp.]TIR04091.1 MAG: hypothetical protein E5X32_22760 [Mesorhizobium sp.]TIR47394.1 MAG: hypothetical protein E5X53_34145 [Mesorhizobium sp.]